MGGEYRVVVLAVGMSEAHAQSIFEQMLEVYKKRLLNQTSFHRGMGYAALKEENDKKTAIRPYYVVVRSKKPAAVIFEVALTAQKCSTTSTPTAWKRADLVKCCGTDVYQPINASFITYIVEWYMGQGDIETAREALAEFRRRAPRHNSHERITRLDKLVGRGRFYRRPGWLDQ